MAIQASATKHLSARERLRRGESYFAALDLLAALDAARNVIDQLLDPQVDEEHAGHGHYDGNVWVRDYDRDCPVCEYQEALERVDGSPA